MPITLQELLRELGYSSVVQALLSTHMALGSVLGAEDRKRKESEV